MCNYYHQLSSRAAQQLLVLPLVFKPYNASCVYCPMTTATCKLCVYCSLKANCKTPLWWSTSVRTYASTCTKQSTFVICPLVWIFFPPLCMPLLPNQSTVVLLCPVSCRYCKIIVCCVWNCVISFLLV